MLRLRVDPTKAETFMLVCAVPCVVDLSAPSKSARFCGEPSPVAGPWLEVAVVRLLRMLFAHKDTRLAPGAANPHTKASWYVAVF